MPIGAGVGVGAVVLVLAIAAAIALLRRRRRGDGGGRDDGGATAAGKSNNEVALQARSEYGRAPPIVDEAQQQTSGIYASAPAAVRTGTYDVAPSEVRSQYESVDAPFGRD